VDDLSEFDRPLQLFNYGVNYCPLVKRTQLTCTAWVEFFNTRNDGRGNYIDPAKNMSLYQCTGRHYLLGLLFVTGLKSNLKHSSNHAEHNRK